jgi:hypothetical protein
MNINAEKATLNRMVAEKKCRHIINLTNCMEGGRVKCFQAGGTLSKPDSIVW